MRTRIELPPFAAVSLPPAPHWPTPFCFYYVRVRQTDGETAWVSPIWFSARATT